MTNEEILQEIIDSKHFKSRYADIYDVDVDGFVSIGWPADNGDTEYALFRPTEGGGVETCRGYYSDGADTMRIYNEELKEYATVQEALGEEW